LLPFFPFASCAPSMAVGLVVREYFDGVSGALDEATFS
jgi:hypothetical protein